MVFFLAGGEGGAGLRPRVQEFAGVAGVRGGGLGEGFGGALGAGAFEFDVAGGAGVAG